MNERTDDGWSEHAKLVLLELERNHDTHDEILKRFNRLDVQIARLETEMKFRAAVTGMFSGGIISVLVGIIVWAITK